MTLTLMSAPFHAASPKRHCLLRVKFFVDALELFFDPPNLLPRRGALRVIQLHCLSTSQPPMGAVHNRG